MICNTSKSVLVPARTELKSILLLARLLENVKVNRGWKANFHFVHGNCRLVVAVFTRSRRAVSKSLPPCSRIPIVCSTYQQWLQLGGWLMITHRHFYLSPSPLVKLSKFWCKVFPYDIRFNNLMYIDFTLFQLELVKVDYFGKKDYNELVN